MVDEFVRKKIIRNKDLPEITQNEVYEKYVAFCNEQGEKPESKIWFGRMMNVFGYSSKQTSKNIRVYRGIKVLD